jgi:hypothetical protein
MLINSNNKCNAENLLKTTNEKSEKINLQRKRSSDNKEAFNSNAVIKDKAEKSTINTPVYNESSSLSPPNFNMDDENECKEIEQDKDNMSSEASSIINEEETQVQEKPLIEMNEFCDKFSTFYNDIYIEK